MGGSILEEASPASRVLESASDLDKSNLPWYDVFGDLVDVHVEGNSVVLRISKRNQPHMTAGTLKKFLGWQVSLTVRKVRPIVPTRNLLR